MTEFSIQTRTVFDKLAGVFDPTPLQFNHFLSDRHQANVWLKREDLSAVRSYKNRGAYAFFMDVIDKGGDGNKFVCASAGNHAQGFSHACRHFKKSGVVFMPVTTPRQKIMKTSAFGAPQIEIRLSGDSFEETYLAATEYCEEQGGIFVPPFDDERIIAGQATVAHEMTKQFPKQETMDLVVMPVGGGGLAAGLTSYFASVSPETDFVFVEPENAASLKAGLEAGRAITLEKVDNFVDGAAVARIGAVNFERLKRFSPDQVVVAPTNGICETMIELLNIEGVVLEPAGALSIDALKRLPKEQLIGKNIVCVVSGGNFDFERLPEVKERALKYSGLKKYFILRLPQRPGALKDFLLMLGPEDDIARFEYLKKSARNFGSVLIGIETTKSENFTSLTNKMERAGFSHQDITDNEIISNLVI